MPNDLFQCALYPNPCTVRAICIFYFDCILVSATNFYRYIVILIATYDQQPFDAECNTYVHSLFEIQSGNHVSLSEINPAKTAKKLPRYISSTVNRIE